jgi:hypothetical protein
VGHEGGGGVEEALGFGFVVVEAFDGLSGEDDAGVEAAESFEEGGGVAKSEGGEFVDQQEDVAVGGLSGGAVVGEVFDEVAGQAGGVVAQREAVEEEIGGAGVLERPLPHQAVAHRGGEGAVAGQGAFAHRGVDIGGDLLESGKKSIDAVVGPRQAPAPTARAVAGGVACR